MPIATMPAFFLSLVIIVVYRFCVGPLDPLLGLIAVCSVYHVVKDIISAAFSD